MSPVTKSGHYKLTFDLPMRTDHYLPRIFLGLAFFVLGLGCVWLGELTSYRIFGALAFGLFLLGFGFFAYGSGMRIGEGIRRRRGR